MDQILLCSNHIPLTTSVHNSFIKNYMLDANGSYVKVYLYLSMCIQSGVKNLSISSLADMMENTEKDILRALHYWEKKELLVLQRNAASNAITSIEMINPDELKKATSEVLPKSISYEIPAFENDSTKTDVLHENTPEYSIPADTVISVSHSAEAKDSAAIPEFAVTKEQTMKLSSDETFSWICLIVESYLGQPLKPAEIELLTYLYDTLKFSKDLILHLYEYCCSIQKTNAKYVQAVAISWAENSITTPEQAKEHSTNYNTSHTAISKALALGRPLAKIECEYVERWHNQWKMDLSVIIEACNRTMLSIQKADFKYIDGILSSWHKKNVHTLQDIHICDEAHKHKKSEHSPKAVNSGNAQNQPKRTQFQAFQQRDTSKEEIDQLEKLLLTR